MKCYQKKEQSRILRRKTNKKEVNNSFISKQKRGKMKTSKTEQMKTSKMEQIRTSKRESK